MYHATRLDSQQDTCADANTSAHEVSSIEVLSQIFEVLDDVSSDLHDCLDAWTPPRVTVIGDQSHGKSTLLERLCLMPLFPRSRALCTTVPVQINFRRCPVALPANLQLWDTVVNKPISKPQQSYEKQQYGQ